MENMEKHQRANEKNVAELKQQVDAFNDVSKRAQRDTEELKDATATAFESIVEMFKKSPIAFLKAIEKYKASESLTTPNILEKLIFLLHLTES